MIMKTLTRSLLILFLLTFASAVYSQNVYYNGSRIGEIKADGDVYVNGSRVGLVDNDGAVSNLRARDPVLEGECAV